MKYENTKIRGIGVRQRLMALVSGKWSYDAEQIVLVSIDMSLKVQKKIRKKVREDTAFSNKHKPIPLSFSISFGGFYLCVSLT